MPEKRVDTDRRRRALRFGVGDLVMVNAKAPDGCRERRGTITAIAESGSECRVWFEDGRPPRTARLKVGWVEL